MDAGAPAARRAWRLSDEELAALLAVGRVEDARRATDAELRASGLDASLLRKVFAGRRREALATWLREARGVEGADAARVLEVAGRVEDVVRATPAELERAVGADLAARLAGRARAPPPASASPRGVEEERPAKRRKITLATCADVLGAAGSTQRPTDVSGFRRGFESLERKLAEKVRVDGDAVVAAVALAAGLVPDPGAARVESDAGVADSDLVSVNGALFRVAFDDAVSRSALLRRCDPAEATVEFAVEHRGRPVLAWRLLRDLRAGDELLVGDDDGDVGFCAACSRGAHSAHTCGRGAARAAPPPAPRPVSSPARRASPADRVTWLCALFPGRRAPARGAAVKVPLCMLPAGGLDEDGEQEPFRAHAWLARALGAGDVDGPLRARLEALPWFAAWAARAAPDIAHARDVGDAARYLRDAQRALARGDCGGGVVDVDNINSSVPPALRRRVVAHYRANGCGLACALCAPARLERLGQVYAARLDALAAGGGGGALADHVGRCPRRAAAAPPDPRTRLGALLGVDTSGDGGAGDLEALARLPQVRAAPRCAFPGCDEACDLLRHFDTCRAETCRVCAPARRRRDEANDGARAAAAAAAAAPPPARELRVVDGALRCIAVAEGGREVPAPASAPPPPPQAAPPATTLQTAVAATPPRAAAPAPAAAAPAAAPAAAAAPAPAAPAAPASAPAGTAPAPSAAAPPALAAAAAPAPAPAEPFPLEVKGFAGLSRVGLSPATMRGLLRRRDGEGAPAAPRDDGVCADCGRSPGRCACDLRFGASACRAAPAGPPAAPRRAASIQRGDSKLRAMEARRHEYEERARAAISPAPRPSSPEPPGAAEPAALDCTPASARWASELVSSFAAGKRDAPPTYRNLLAEVCSPTNQAQADEVNEAIDAIFGGAPPPAAAARPPASAAPFRAPPARPPAVARPPAPAAPFRAPAARPPAPPARQARPPASAAPFRAPPARPPAPPAPAARAAPLWAPRPPAPAAPFRAPPRALPMPRPPMPVPLRVQLTLDENNIPTATL